jgi:hypothetical protein
MMTAQDRDYLYMGGALAALAVLWYFARKSAASAAQPLTPAQASPALPTTWQGPMDTVYNSSTSGAPYAPPSGADLTVNIADQTASELSDQFMPLFGFVGVAQGDIYQ